MKTNDIMVSINCLVFNHEPFLRQCLDGFVMQKTNFKFEVLIHDDASTDKSAEIIREYEQKYPNIIKPIYQIENQHSKGIKINFTYQYPRAKGKYMAFCEGDDYWTDPCKLQKQFDAMEAHPECSLCVHQVNKINVEATMSLGAFPLKQHKSGIISRDEWMNNKKESMAYYQTSSYFARTIYVLEFKQEFPVYAHGLGVGDTPLLMFLILKGSFYYLRDIMSYYRFQSGGWTSNYNNSHEYLVKFNIKLKQMYQLYDIYTSHLYSKSLMKKMKELDFYIFIFSKKYKINLLSIDMKVKYSLFEKLRFSIVFIKKILNKCFIKIKKFF